MRKGIFIETENVNRFRTVMRQALDTERGRPGMVCVYSPAGLGKSLAEVQIALSMARVFYKLDLELESPNYELKTKTAPTPGPAMDFKVRVKGLRH